MNRSTPTVLQRRFLPQQICRTRRSGFSLIEVSLLVSLVTALGLLATSFIIQLLDLDTHMARSTAIELQLSRFEDQLRLDAAQADALQVDDQQWTFFQPDASEIVYSVRGDRITRSQSLSRRTARETWLLPDVVISLHSTAELSPQLLELVIQAQLASDRQGQSALLGPQLPSEQRLVVPLGRNSRYAAASMQEAQP